MENFQIDAYPQPVNDYYSLEEDTPLVIAAPGLLANDIDPEGDPLSVTLSQGTQHGEISLSQDGSFSYIPDADFHGIDQFAYSLSDSLGSALTRGHCGINYQTG